MARTTRNVATTEAGDRLLRSIAPLFEQITAEVEALGALRDKPAGNIRISCTDDVIKLYRLAGKNERCEPHSLDVSQNLLT